MTLHKASSSEDLSFNYSDHLIFYRVPNHGLFVLTVVDTRKPIESERRTLTKEERFIPMIMNETSAIVHIYFSRTASLVEVAIGKRVSSHLTTYRNL